jgi:hypothetical protein
MICINTALLHTYIITIWSPIALTQKKALKAAVAIAAAYGLCRVSKDTKFPQLATANAPVLIAIIAILYGPCMVKKKLPKQA